MLVAIIQGNNSYRKLFEKRGYDVVCLNTKAEIDNCDFNKIDMVCFTGGADVNPSMYGHTKHQTTRHSVYDDMCYKQAYLKAKGAKLHMPMVGICRGSQFLCVVSGGVLIQDLRGHTTGHDVETVYEEKYAVTSTHHQMQYPLNMDEKEYEVLAWADHSHSCEMHIDGEVHKITPLMDIEAVYYPVTKALAFQPHPEFGEGSCQDLFWRLFDEYLMEQSYE